MNSETNKQNFRSAKTPDGVVVFPFPPIKGKKWLVLIKNEANVLGILKKLNEGTLQGPLIDGHQYHEKGLHSDGQTPLYTLKDEDLHSQ